MELGSAGRVKLNPTVNVLLRITEVSIKFSCLALSIRARAMKPVSYKVKTSHHGSCLLTDILWFTDFATFVSSLAVVF